MIFGPIEKMPTVLITTDNTEDVKVVQHLLNSEYHNIFTSTNPDTMMQDFEFHRPDVLVLAFNTLEKAERYNLGLYRLSSLVHN